MLWIYPRAVGCSCRKSSSGEGWSPYKCRISLGGPSMPLGILWVSLVSRLPFFHRSYFRSFAHSSNLQPCHLPFPTNAARILLPTPQREWKSWDKTLLNFLPCFYHLCYSHTHLSLSFVTKGVFFLPRMIFPSVLWISHLCNIRCDPHPSQCWYWWAPLPKWST